MADVRQHSKRKKAPRDLFSLTSEPKPFEPRPWNRQKTINKHWQRYLRSLRDKDAQRQRIEAENAKVPF
jgi:hypothetical protein